MKNKLIELRKLTGLNQSQFAEKVGTFGTRISNMETGLSPVTLKTLKRYSKILGIDIEIIVNFKSK